MLHVDHHVERMAVISNRIRSARASRNSVCNTQKGSTLANHSPRKCGSGRDSLCRIPETQGARPKNISKELRIKV